MNDATHTMPGLFNQMMESLEKVSVLLQRLIDQVNRGVPLHSSIPEESWDQYGDAILALQDRLVQLESLIILEYPFDAIPPENVIAYYALLKEYEEPCREKLEYLADRPGFGFEDPGAAVTAALLQNVMYDIIDNSISIYRIMGPY